jgi:hypothetical protein
VDDGLDEAENVCCASLSKRAQKPGSPNHSDQCLQRRNCGDETNRTENQKGNAAWLSCPIKEADICLYLVLASKTI